MTNDSNLKNDKEQPKHLIPLISDYGFKVSFATDCLFSRKAIQVLIDSDMPIQHLDMSRNEFEGISLEARSGLYDIVCRDEHMRVFIVEMQVDNYTVFIQRLLFYTFHMYCAVVSKGKMGFLNLPPIYCVCIIEGAITPFEGFYNKVTLQNQKGVVFAHNIEFHVIELGKFPILQSDFMKVETDMEKFAYTLKYAHHIDPTNEAERPPFWKKDWLDEIMKKIDLNRMSPEQRVMFDMSLVKEVMYHQKIEETAKEATEKAHETTILKGWQKGYAVADLAELTNLSIPEVENIILQHKSIQQD
jgi:predicted transposase/invertase (TIGR01784 family)